MTAKRRLGLVTGPSPSDVVQPLDWLLSGSVSRAHQQDGALPWERTVPLMLDLLAGLGACTIAAAPGAPRLHIELTRPAT